jgi:ABC-2 type transport system ATP-binding protein
MTAEADTTVIDVAGLVREFRLKKERGRRRGDVLAAVDGISFTLTAGETVGYIGANGAGKSTTIKIIMGILTPTRGTVRTCGLAPVKQRARLAKYVGVVFGQRSQLWWDLPLVDSFRVLGAIHRLPPARLAQRRDELVERLDLAPFLDRPVRQLSLGQRMRGEVAAALLHSPRLIVLDEPTVGLDVLSKERLRLFLADELAAHGRTLLLTTHDMDDVERLCRRLLVVDHGRLVYDGDQAGLVARVGARRVLVVDLAKTGPALDDIPGTELLGAEGDGLRQRLAFSPEMTTAAEVLAAVSETAPVRDLSIEEPDIEDVVRRLYESSP